MFTLFPESDRVVFGVNPLVEVVCQFRFPAVLRIAAEVPSNFQERIRHHFPLFRTQTFPTIFSGITGSPHVPNVAGANVIHEFSSENNAWTVSLSSEYLALTTRQYQHWEDFLARLEQPLTALKEIYEPAFFSRVGLRYQDVIRRSQLGIEDTPWSRLLKPEIIGFLANSSMEDAVQETAGQSLLTHDEQGGRVRLQHGFAQLPGDQEICYLIDSDFFTDNRIGVHDGLAILNNFNKSAGNLFRWCITPELREVLRPRNVDELSSGG